MVLDMQALAPPAVSVQLERANADEPDPKRAKTMADEPAGQGQDEGRRAQPKEGLKADEPSQKEAVLKVDEPGPAKAKSKASKADKKVPAKAKRKRSSAKRKRSSAKRRSPPKRPRLPPNNNDGVTVIDANPFHNTNPHAFWEGGLSEVVKELAAGPLTSAWKEMLQMMLEADKSAVKECLEPCGLQLDKLLAKLKL